jgi:hypothetical protein
MRRIHVANACLAWLVAASLGLSARGQEVVTVGTTSPTLIIEYDSDVLSLDAHLISSCLPSARIAKAVKEAVSRAGEDASEVGGHCKVRFIESSLRPNLLPVQIVLYHSASETLAGSLSRETWKKIMEQATADVLEMFETSLRDRYQRVLSGRQERRAAERILLKEKLEAALAEADRAGRELGEFEAGRASSELLGQQLRDMEHRRRETELELLTLKARRAGLENQLEKAQRRTEDAEQARKILVEHEKLVAIQTELVKQLRALQKSGQTSPVEIKKAEMDLVSARINLEQARQALRDPEQQRMQQELSELALRSIELHVLQESLGEDIERLQERQREALLADTKAETYRLEAQLAQQRVVQIRSRLSELEDDSQFTHSLRITRWSD